jgi:hypothetical protein
MEPHATSEPGLAASLQLAWAPVPSKILAAVLALNLLCGFTNQLGIGQVPGICRKESGQWARAALLFGGCLCRLCGGSDIS